MKLTDSPKTTLIIIAVGLLANLLTIGPDLYKAIHTPKDKWFTGQASWFDPWDKNVYLSAIGWGKRDGILFENLYDTESAQAAPIYPFYTLSGKVLAPFNLPNIKIFHIASFALCILLTMAIWWFVKIFLKEWAEKVTALAIIFLGGGLGWLFFPETTLPDIGLPNFTLARAVDVPHEAASLSLFLLSLGFLWQGSTRKKSTPLLLGGFSSLLMLLFHPYSAIPLGATLTLFGLYHWAKTGSFNQLKSIIPPGLAGIVYYFLVARPLVANPNLSGLISQTQHSPAPFPVIFGWGLIFPLALIALLSRKSEDKTVFLKIWFVTHLLTIYLPLGFQKLMIRGLWVPIVILAVMGAKETCRRLNWDYRTAMILLIVFASFSTFFMSYKRITESPENRWIYLTKEEGEAIDYLRTHGENEEGVLASYRIANIIPAHTTKRVWAGHRFQTPDFEKRINEVYRFFAGQMNKEEAKELFKKAKVNWVFWGPEEKAIAGLYEIPTKNLLEPAIEGEIVSLYKVTWR